MDALLGVRIRVSDDAFGVPVPSMPESSSLKKSESALIIIGLVGSDKTSESFVSVLTIFKFGFCLSYYKGETIKIVITKKFGAYFRYT